jgi:cyclic-di-AMP phosphodiesterase PgpH
VMLADGAEAATRALADPTPERIREVIDGVVRARIEQGQLREAPLTMRQLTVIKQQFARVLGGMYHARVDYPTPPLGVEAVRR